jgi:hypothetical protein
LCPESLSSRTLALCAQPSKCAPRTLTLRFKLKTAARVELSLIRKVRGTDNEWTPLGGMARAGHAGENVRTIGQRYRGRKLIPGFYRWELLAKSTAGFSKVFSLTFTAKA